MEKKIKHILKVIKLNENTLSMFFGIVTVILVSVLAFRMYSENKPEISPESEQVVASSSPTPMLGDVKLEQAEDGVVYPAELPEKYTVVSGDHLWKISEKLYGSGYNWVDIARENNITSPGTILVGQELKLPRVAVKMTEDQKLAVVTKTESPISIEGDSYTVVKGDTLWSISLRAYADGYRYPEIASANGITNANVIEVGQVIKLPR
jgi:nucleoid-associated protein YgaU